MQSQRLKELIGKGRLDLVIEVLKTYMESLSDPSQFNDLTELSSRWYNNEKEHKLNHLLTNEYNVEFSKISSALLELIGKLPENTQLPDIPEQFFSASNLRSDIPFLNKESKGSNQLLKWIIIAIVIIGAVFIVRHLFTPNPGPIPDPNPGPSQPDVTMNIQGAWLTNVPNLVYVFEQTGNSFTWKIVGAPDTGTGSIEGDKLIVQVGGRTVVFDVTKKFADGNPAELQTHDPQYQNLIIFRQQ